MTLRLAGSTSGYTELDAPAVAGSNTLILPTGNGSNGNILGTDGAGNLSWVHGRMVLETAKASTSGTSVDFTGIPSWVKRVTVMFNGVSTSGTSVPLIRLGSSGGIETSGYVSHVGGASSATSDTTRGGSSTDGIRVAVNVHAAADLITGNIVFAKLTGNTWIVSGAFLAATIFVATVVGSKALSDTLTQLRITTVNGTDTFDAGSINILYEG